MYAARCLQIKRKPTGTTLRRLTQLVKQLWVDPMEKQTDRKMTSARMSRMKMTMSHIFLCCHHILRRSATPVRWKRSACMIVMVSFHFITLSFSLFFYILLVYHS